MRKLARKVCFNRPRAAHFFLMRLANLNSACKPSFCACLKKAHSVAWADSASASYVLQSRPTVEAGAWATVGGAQSVEDGRRSVLDPVGPASRFYRLCAVAAGPNCEPAIVVSQPLQLTGAVGANLTLSLAATGTLPITFQWRRNEVFLPGETNSSLTLSNVQRTDGGAYDALVGNACSCLPSCPILVTVGGEAAVLADNFAARIQTNGVSALQGHGVGHDRQPTRKVEDEQVT